MRGGMCLHDELPGPVAEALARYRRILEENGPNWVESSRSYYGPFLHYLRFVELPDLLAPSIRAAMDTGLAIPEAIEAAIDGDHDTDFREALGGRVPDGLIALRLEPGGARIEAAPAPPALDGDSVDFVLLADSALDHDAVFRVGDREVTVPAGRARTLQLAITAAQIEVSVDGVAVAVPELLRPVAAARLRLRAPQPSRWSVLSSTGCGWFPEGSLQKWDALGNAYFHGTEVLLDVPAEELTVRVARGMDFGSAQTLVTPKAGEETLVELAAPRRRDTGSWVGGDLHLHLNCGGDQVCAPADGAVMQRGEALAVMNPLACNGTTSFVYDRELLEATAGQDLPWSEPGMIARMGAEYRNDQLGHVGSFGLTGPPPIFYAGHPESDRPADRPSNAAMCAELRRLGAITVWAHPLMMDPGGHDPLDGMFGFMVRSTECRELVADAALGLVDGMDVLTHLSCRGAAEIYRRLIGAGVRLAVTAGTDVFLSHKRNGMYSNPPGWARVYARLEGPLNVPNFQDAVRAGRTFATNGPWLDLVVDGKRPGATLDVEHGEWLNVSVRSDGPYKIKVYDADGIVGVGEGKVEFAYAVQGPTYLVAEIDGGADPHSLDPRGAYAHTSPVFIEMTGRHVARTEDLTWCLSWLDRLEAFMRERGTDPDPEIFSVVDQARAVYQGRF